MSDLIKQFAEAVKAEGGEAYFVGGCVRDKLMGIEPKDFDIECYSIEPDKLEAVCSRFGKVSNVGKKFQVFKLGQDIDVSLPRLDKKVGVGHRGFETIYNCKLDFYTALSRRDLTVNAIMENVLTGQIIDPFNGREAIKNRTLRMVSPTSFREDSLRVLRLAQFASRLGFGIEAETAEFAKRTDLSDLPKERVWMELEKMFLKSEDVSVGVRYLFELEIAEKLFPSLREPSYNSIRMAGNFCGDLTQGQKLAVLVALTTWASDLTVLDEFGLTSVDGFNVRKDVEELHLLPVQKLETDYDFHKCSQKMNMKLAGKIFLAYLSPFMTKFLETIKRLGIEDKPVEPILRGRDLIDMGMQPSPEFGKILDEVYELQLQNIITNSQEARDFARTKLL